MHLVAIAQGQTISRSKSEGLSKKGSPFTV
jgi:hypothetical protein